MQENKKIVPLPDVQKKPAQQIRQESQEESCEIREIPEEAQSCEVTPVSESEASSEQVSPESQQTKESTKQDSNQGNQKVKNQTKRQMIPFFHICLIFIMGFLSFGIFLAVIRGFYGVLSIIVLVFVCPFLAYHFLFFIADFREECKKNKNILEEFKE